MAPPWNFEVRIDVDKCHVSLYNILKPNDKDQELLVSNNKKDGIQKGQGGKKKGKTN
jgi:hypothetical protein